MSDLLEITAETVRQTLLDRARSFARTRGCSLSLIGEKSIKDSKFLARVQAGDNFTIKTYQRVIDWIDAAEASARPAPEKTEAAA